MVDPETHAALVRLGICASLAIFLALLYKLCGSCCVTVVALAKFALVCALLTTLAIHLVDSCLPSTARVDAVRYVSAWTTLSDLLRTSSVGAIRHGYGSGYAGVWTEAIAFGRSVFSLLRGFFL